MALLFLFVFLIEHEIVRRKYRTIRTVTIEYGIHGGVAREGAKRDRWAARRTTCN
jgi:hypothetical protein